MAIRLVAVTAGLSHAADITANLSTGFASADLATVKARVSAAEALALQQR